MKTASTTHYLEINTHRGRAPRRTWYTLTCYTCKDGLGQFKSWIDADAAKMAHEEGAK
jgi:hypothetical protein